MELRRWMKWRNQFTLIVTFVLLVPYSLFSFYSLFKLYLPINPMQTLAIYPVIVLTNRSATITSRNRSKLLLSSSSGEILNTSTLSTIGNGFHQRQNEISSSSSSTTQTSRVKPHYAIFYNIYIDPKNVTHGAQIVQEQTMQIFTKLDSQKRVSKVPLFYNMIGYNYSGPICPQELNCTFLRYYEKAFEEVTLQNLHEYCVQNPYDEVYYLHNKGSFSTVSYNNQKRIKSTGSLLHKGQRLLGQRHRNCNVASLGWEPLPHWHNRGNFWLARCSNVRKLIPPKELDRVRVSLFRRLLHPTNRKPSWACLRSYFDESIDDIYKQHTDVQHGVGVGRYNNEIWITSHPDVVPCDGTETAFRGNITDKLLFKHPFAEHEWFRMHGRLFEFYQLYGKLPSNSSFFWDYYAAAQEPMTPRKCKKGWNRTSYYQPM